MNFIISIKSPKLVQRFSFCLVVTRKFCDPSFDGDEGNKGSECIDQPVYTNWAKTRFYSVLLEKSDLYAREKRGPGKFPARRYFLETTRIEGERVLEVLKQYLPGSGFDLDLALDELQITVSHRLMKEVLFGILKNVNYATRKRCSSLAQKFFSWSAAAACKEEGVKRGYVHSTNSYHLMLKIFSECEEVGKVKRLVDEMIEKEVEVTAQTFNILIRTCGECGETRQQLEKFVKSKTFIYKPYHNPYNAILHCLVVAKQDKLIEWVYAQMLNEGISPDILTYNVVLWARYRLGKLEMFNRLACEMIDNGCSPDFHTYNIFLHVAGKAGNLKGALNFLERMRRDGFGPNLLHFTTLIDGLSRAGDLDACEIFFGMMKKEGCMPDVVCYTVMITGYVVASKLDKAQEMFDEMISKGQLPNVFTYNAMIRGFCMAEKFKEARTMLKDMEYRGCNPNAHVYSTIVSYLRNAGKISEADEVLREMNEKGKYRYLDPKFEQNRRFRYVRL
ncbi:hypothetical protein FNV43_RR24093 [Rhamnella rubrinervis]|uniref:Pentatricopeptide repeat-containing protein n=1 Tax=Rhamnella rubrinervis TaxID=2594499 RepID=A0A8K0DQH5_9ROSA|nr:hypothetical protein FNV43_RR24093 [Rhamnella rubrinervis]